MTTNKQLGYLLIEENNNTYRGAVLITDFRGIPMDFRYTDPVSPTRIERVLYGNALDVYLREELILQSLVSSVEMKPVLWICREDSFLAPLRKVSRGKVVTLSDTARSFLNQTGNMEPQIEKGVFLLQVDPVSSPLRLCVESEREGEANDISAILVEAARTMELLEPFTRIEKALRAIEDERENSQA
ncbi:MULTISPECIES: hypothetical protein [Aminobacterium]|jgi:hypothetical protein|uniref:hypothetical protein n=1 Tax=Aminobacterium TaxID=81466 RepID=UPI00257C2184|nr:MULTISPECIES: hypothetical protein [unclassified Aminobacterium]